VKKWFSDNKIDILFIVTLIGLVFLFLYRLFLPHPRLIVTPDFIKSDAWHIFIAGKYLLQQSLINHTFPIWTNLLDSGFPLLGEGQVGMFFLPNILLFGFFDFITAFNLSLLLSFCLIGIGMYVWLRSMKYSYLPSFFGAVTLEFSGIMIAHLTHQALIQGLSLLPWVMWASLMIYKKQSAFWLGVFALFASQQLCSGFPQTSVVTLLFTGSYYLWLVWLSPQKLNKIWRFICAVLLTIGLSAVQILPSQEYIKHTSAEYGLALQDATRYSFSLPHLMTFLNPFILGNPQNGTYPELLKNGENIFWENSGYIGLIPFIFIVILFLFRKKTQFRGKSLSLFLLFSLIISFLLMWGKYSPFYLLYSWWPLNQFRVPARFIWIFDVSLILLAVQGFEFTIISIKKNHILKYVLILLIIINTGDIFINWWNYHLLGSKDEWLNKPSLSKLINNQDRITSLFFEYDYENQYNKGWQDSEPFEFLQNTLSPNSNLLWDIPSNGITGGRFLRRSTYVDNLFMDSILISTNSASMSSISINLLKLQSVDKIISTIPFKSNELKQEILLTKNDINIYLYSINDSIPRAYLATNFEVATTLEEAQVKLINKNFIAGKSVLLEENINIENGQKQGKVEIVENKDLIIKLKVTDNQAASVLVLADTYYPGWEAKIDNMSTKIYPANIRQRAVIVPQGNHEIVFEYKPKSFLAGVWISGISYLVIIFYGIYKAILYQKKYSTK